MDNSPQTLKIKIGGRDVTIGCAPEQQQNLLNAASVLNAEISNIQNTASTTSVSLESAAIIAALNFAAQIIENNSRAHQFDFDSLIDKIDATLAD